jgi:transketolase
MVPSELDPIPPALAAEIQKIAPDLKTTANELRIWIVDMLMEAKSGHPGGSLSAIDLLTALWFHGLRTSKPGAPLTQDRDRFVLSKGHGVPALYAVLAKLGYIKQDLLKTLRKTGSDLQGHPDRVRMPILEASTGSLGQGLSVAQGLALGMKLDGKPYRVYCMLGDGETQEGQVWEAAMSAPKFKLGNLCAILDHNNGQIDGFVDAVMPIEPVADKWRAFGWDVVSIDGHDMPQILGAYARFRQAHESGSAKPVLIHARTVKGKGVSFMENKIEWHGIAPKAEEAKRAREELQGARK